MENNNEKTKIEDPADVIADHAVLQIELLDLKNHVNLTINRVMNLLQKMENKALK